MTDTAAQLARWAHAFDPSPTDLQLADRSLLDTVAVALAGADHPLVGCADGLGVAGRWAVAAHVLDFDDLHLPSTSHISAVIVPTVLACGGGARAYLAGAGVMARLGAMLGWSHYSSGWHATCTSGAPAAAVAAAVSLGLGEEATAHAIALAVPAAGGVQRAFGTDAKSLQVGFAADAGVRAALLAARGCRADLAAVEQWLELLGAEVAGPDLAGDAVPGGLAIKLFPCCYAMQRPIGAIREALAGGGQAVTRIVVRTPACTVQPLIHHRPVTGLEGKFSLEYAVAAAVLDDFPDFVTFSDDQVQRPEARRLVQAVEVQLGSGDGGLLDGAVEVEVHLADGTVGSATMAEPPGSPTRPPTPEELGRKLAACGPGVPELLRDVTWSGAADLLRARVGGTVDMHLVTDGAGG